MVLKVQCALAQRMQLRLVAWVRRNAILPALFAQIIDMLNQVSPLIMNMFAMQRDAIVLGADICSRMQRDNSSSDAPDNRYQHLCPDLFGAGKAGEIPPIVPIEPTFRIGLTHW